MSFAIAAMSPSVLSAVGEFDQLGDRVEVARRAAHMESLLEVVECHLRPPGAGRVEAVELAADDLESIGEKAVAFEQGDAFSDGVSEKKGHMHPCRVLFGRERVVGRARRAAHQVSATQRRPWDRTRPRSHHRSLRP